ncbi:Hypothetical cytosolic protein [Bacillus thuringiensis serovar israelensis ATCC 35646]|nr:Hypothetical cytosolic protein [Bacillus thuringiensis serovar israelensis ATCC 35646]
MSNVRRTFRDEICFGMLTDQSIRHSHLRSGVKIYSSELQCLAQRKLHFPKMLQVQFEKMVDALEDLEDVQQVYHNVDLGE